MMLCKNLGLGTKNAYVSQTGPEPNKHVFHKPEPISASSSSFWQKQPPSFRLSWTDCRTNRQTHSRGMLEQQDASRESARASVRLPLHSRTLIAP